ncbi:hypothetical protein VE03_09937 [Pseudogymnoascus sp. 23342-1-I1]|nr:hypothetical protein VE03_09937 [Pseudogymnoascus sp. 23342-1-I1]
MATTNELQIIRSNLVNDGLGAFRRLFEVTRVDLGIAVPSGAVQAVFSTAVTTVAKNLVLDLILAFRGTLLGDLSAYVTLIDSNNFDIKSAIPLVERVIKNAPDLEIWSAVVDLVALTSPKQLTPPTAFEKAVFDTPLRSSLASQTGSEQTHDEVDQRILEELTGRAYYDVREFFERYFEGKIWTNNTRNIYEKSKDQYAEDRWKGWLEPLADRKLDFFLAPADSAILNGEHDWSNVLVIREHKQNADEDGSLKTLLQLAGYAREVFGSQPDRRFVPGFTIYGSVMRLWVFDRSGPYSSEKFDIHKEPERFIQVIAGYALMTDAELGLNTYIGRDGISTSSTTISSSRQKRKRDGFVNGSGGTKRSKSGDSRTDVEIATDAESGDPNTTDFHSIQEPKPDSLAGCESETYGNRIHCCLVVSPAGRPLHAYRSTKELLEALRDAVRGHKSLLEDGKILHRDISENNIIVTEAASKGEPKGRLIDLDLAKELDSVPSGASHRTGTMQFMAIEVLQGKGHTYRHDLESFFYVFIWMYVRYGHVDMNEGQARKESRPQIASTKLGHIDKNGFEDIIAEFAPRFENLKGLARELRNVLFPIRDGAIFTGTFRDNDIMYDGMIKAFNSTITSAGQEEQENAHERRETVH